MTVCELKDTNEEQVPRDKATVYTSSLELIMSITHLSPIKADQWDHVRLASQ